MDRAILRTVKHLKSDIELILDENAHEVFLSEEQIREEYRAMDGKELEAVLRNVNLTLAKIIEDVRPKMYSFVNDIETPGYLKREVITSRGMIAGPGRNRQPAAESASNKATPIPFVESPVAPPPGFSSNPVDSAETSRSSSLAPGSNRPKPNGQQVEDPTQNGRSSPSIPMSFDLREKENHVPVVTLPASRSPSIASHQAFQDINHMGHEPKPLTDEELRRHSEVLLDDCKKNGYGDDDEVEMILDGLRRGMHPEQESPVVSEPEPRGKWHSVLDGQSYGKINEPIGPATLAHLSNAEQHAIQCANRGLDQANFKISMDQMFYLNKYWSIKNSGDVNAYRSNYLIPHIKKTTVLYETPANEKLLNFINCPDYHAAILYILQFHAMSYPKGSDAEELEHFEREFQKETSPFKLGVDTAISSMAECVRRGLLIKEGTLTKPLFRTNDAIRSLDLWRLPPGLPSNLFRVLNTFGEQKLCELVSRTDICLDANGDFLREELHMADFVRLANNFPLVFQLNSHDKQVYSQEVLTSLRLERECPTWKVLLDCPNYSDNIFFCDCRTCCSFTPVTYDYNS
ncbi:unnamed protein product [Bursaphelenchus xylophilus]|uniref:(pine wood nematode) hypothetical protein n=1 Tax=Bursaphelenchus xylophilus TaxID=6326 RepID=A0A1I7S0R7_BURXY|nr:unnamed protein product [Bursaphelenchus xylophilus]CAG9088308.1 unnamed protein product [Bursaphelenchus xylophilus]